MPVNADERGREKEFSCEWDAKLSLYAFVCKATLALVHCLQTCSAQIREMRRAFDRFSRIRERPSKPEPTSQTTAPFHPVGYEVFFEGANPIIAE